MSRAVRTLYRLLRRIPSQMEREGIPRIEIQPSMDKNAWLQNGGGHGWVSAPPAYNREIMEMLLPFLPPSKYSPSFTPAELRAAVRSEFRSPSIPAAAGSSELLDRAFTALKVLLEQLHLARCSSTATTEGVRVDVCSAFVGNQAELDPTYDPESDTHPPKLFFTYRVRVSNLGSHTVQLKSRHWMVRDAADQVVAEVAKGARGVVGCTPILKPDTCFQYFSGTDSEAPGGSMTGSFEMAVLNRQGTEERAFDAEIAPFRFLKPENGGS